MNTEKLRTRFNLHFKLHWKNYLWQSAIATFVLYLLLRFLTTREIVIISSVAATAFIVFCTPSSPLAKPRNVIGAHLLGILTGSLVVLIPQLPTTVGYSFAVGLNIFLMLLTATVHPPACGTALGFAISGITVEAVVAILVSTTTLSLGRFLLRKYLKDLL